MSSIDLYLDTTRIYDCNEKSKKKFLINVGGARSSKSHSIAQLLIKKLFKIPNRKIAICRKTFPALRLTAYKLVVDLLAEYRVYNTIRHNKSEHTITNPENGAFISFLSIDDPQKIKSTEWNDIWLEEADEFTWEDWIIIQTRLSGKTTKDVPNRIYLSLNPSDEQGWVNQRLMLSERFAKDIEIIKSSYRDNPFLDKDYIQILEELKHQDANAYRVFAQGEWGMLSNVIYQPYELLPAFPPNIGERLFGIDFGFNVPTAVVELGVRDLNHVYVRELLYQTHLTNSQLIDKLKEVIPADWRSAPIYADCAEPDRIQEIYQAGFNIHEADKEVNNGIDFCKRKKFYTIAENVNLNKERATYKWRQDKNGNVLDEPVKFMDHLMDAKRYALYTHFKGYVQPSAGWGHGNTMALPEVPEPEWT